MPSRPPEDVAAPSGGPEEGHPATLLDASVRDLWVFGYGSLMWRPGFLFEVAVPARIMGWRRRFCIYSVLYRGTPERPGLVLGLDRGGVCDGLAFRVARSEAAKTLAYLRAREQVTGVYREALVPATLATPDRAQVLALAYLVERAHPGYAGDLSLQLQARFIRGGRGVSGANLDYLVNTLQHLEQLGIREPELERLLSLVGAFVAHGKGDLHETARAVAMARVHGRRTVPALRIRTDRRKRFIYRRAISVRSF